MLGRTLESSLRKLALLFLRSTSKGPLTEALSPEKNGRFVERSRKLGLGKLFRLVGRFAGLFLTARMKVRIQEYLINRFRIPVNWQPQEALQQHFEKALVRLREARDGSSIGDYLEFGVYQGNSLLCMHRALADLGLDKVRLFGFDSFEGLPESATMDEVWSPGQFRSDIEYTKERLSRNGADWKRTTLVKGFYSDTLTDGLTNRLGLERAAVIMIDCDLYTSTREALAFCAPLIRDEAVIFFDDWHATGEDKGEKRAFREFLEKHPDLTAEDFGTYLDNARVFFVARQTAT